MADIRDLIEAHPDGISLPDLYELARSRINPDLTPAQFAGELERIGDLVQDGDLLRVPQPARGDPERPPPRGLRRLVAIDLETVLRYTEQRPEGERTIFQVGAVRFGPDPAWAASAPPFDRFVRLSDDLAARIVRDDLRDSIARDGGDPAAVLADLLDFLEGADAIVAYNGRAFDFPLLDEALARVGAEVPPGIRRIDGLYLAIAVWPVPPRRHALSRLINEARLDEVKARLEVDLTGLVAHDAADDARMLADLMRFAAAEVETWPTDLASLVRSIGRESDAWVALFGLLSSPPPVAVFDAIDVRAVIGAAIGSVGKAPLRQPAASGVPDFSALAGPGGIDLGRLVGASLGTGTPVRDSQTEMLAAMRAWIADGHDALVEAPTGTGKTFVLLAAALDWLAADPANRVVISTFTQLARAIYRLHEAGVVPGLIESTSLAKGAANRLSLAGLIRSLADASDPARVARRGDVVGQTGFAELAIYLASRLVTQGSPVEEWEAHSVDPVDIEPFFDDYLAERRGRPSRRGLYLRYLSQAEAGDYRANESSPAEHTSTVREVLDRHRLLVTNHALLLAHLDDFPAPDRTLLIVDESHSLEGAVTDALSARLDWALVEEAHAELRDWIRPPAVSSSPDEVERYDWLRDMFRALDDLLDGETVPRSASRLFDAAAGRDPLHRDALRVVTLPAPSTLQSRRGRASSGLSRTSLTDLSAWPRRSRARRTGPIGSTRSAARRSAIASTTSPPAPGGSPTTLSRLSIRPIQLRRRRTEWSGLTSAIGTDRASEASASGSPPRPSNSAASRDTERSRGHSRGPTTCQPRCGSTARSPSSASAWRSIPPASARSPSTRHSISGVRRGSSVWPTSRPGASRRQGPSLRSPSRSAGSWPKWPTPTATGRWS